MPGGIYMHIPTRQSQSCSRFTVEPNGYAILPLFAILAWTHSHCKRGGAMGAKLRSWWQQIKQHRVAIGVVAIVLVVVIAIINIGYQFDWTGFKGKTAWDWLQLLGVLAIPVVVGFGVAWFTRVQQQR